MYLESRKIQKSMREENWIKSMVYMIKFVNDLQQVAGFLRALQFLHQ